jgi:hypothetical protein
MLYNKYRDVALCQCIVHPDQYLPQLSAYQNVSLRLSHPKEGYRRGSSFDYKTRLLFFILFRHHDIRLARATQGTELETNKVDSGKPN